MTTQTAAAPTTRTDQQVPRQVKLAAAWTSFMCLYIYVDVLAFILRSAWNWPRTPAIPSLDR